MKFRDRSELGGSGEKLPFVKLQDGEKIVGVFKGELYDFGLIWDTKTVVPFGTPGAMKRFRVNFVTKEGASYVAKIIEQGITFYELMMDLNESYPLEETVVEIKRTGKTKDDTRYSILPLQPKMQPDQAKWKVINSVPLLNLRHDAKVQASQEPMFDGSPLPNFDEHPEIPF